MLLLRRAAAIAIDAAIIFGLASLLIAVSRVLDMHVNGDTALLVITSVLVLTEVLRAQTPGKFAMRLLVRQRQDLPADTHKIILRAALIVCTIIAGYCLVDLLFVYGVAHAILDPFSTFILVVTIMAWPISVIVRGGHVGMHDVIAGTYVSDVQAFVQPDVQPRTPPRNFHVKSIVVASAAAVLAAAAMTRVAEVARPLLKSHLIDVEPLTKLADVLDGIEGHDELIRDCGLVSRRWTKGHAEQITFRENVDGLGDKLALTEHTFAGVAEYHIGTTFEGLLNGDFHRSVARRLASLTPSNTILIVDFVTRDSVGPMKFALSKRIVAFEVMDSGNKRPMLLVAEPDQSMGLKVGADVTALMRRQQ